MSNIKMKCAGCGKDLIYFRQVLAMGPKGYRRYAFCDKCAAKVEKGQKAGGGTQKAERRMQKAGA